MFKIFILLIFIFLIGTLIFYGYRFSRLVKISRGIVTHTTPYSFSGSASGVSLLVLGDSTAVWVGADNPDDTIAAMLAKYIGATRVENRWVSWAVVADVYSQIEKVEAKEYDYILLQIGGNDMTRLHDLGRVAKDYESLMLSLPKHKNLIVMSCGNLGGARIFPSIIGYLYERVSRSYHAKFSEIVTRHGGVYIEIFDERAVDPFIREPELYLAPDLFHPSSIGYKYWFTKLESQIRTLYR